MTLIYLQDYHVTTIYVEIPFLHLTELPSQQQQGNPAVKSRQLLQLLAPPGLMLGSHVKEPLPGRRSATPSLCSLHHRDADIR